MNHSSLIYIMNTEGEYTSHFNHESKVEDIVKKNLIHYDVEQEVSPSFFCNAKPLPFITPTIPPPITLVIKLSIATIEATSIDTG